MFNRAYSYVPENRLQKLCHFIFVFVPHGGAHVDHWCILGPVFRSIGSNVVLGCFVGQGQTASFVCLNK